MVSKTILKSYKVREKYESAGSGVVIVARSSGQAKAQYLRWLDMDGVKYIDLRVSVVECCLSSERFLETAKYRNVPFARVGMRVRVGDQSGVIIGHNSSANFDVLFDADSKYPDQRLNCHPNWDISYFSNNGTLIKSFGRDR